MNPSLRWLQTFVLVQLVIFVLSLPGVGLETRAPSQYAPWAGPIFLLLTVLVFALGIASLAVSGRRRALGFSLGGSQAAAALVTNLFDFSHIGGPAPPLGPFVLGLFSILVALAQLAIVVGLARSTERDTPARSR